MSNTKISALTSATTPLAGTEVIPVVQSGATVKATVQNILSATQPSGAANGVMRLNASKVTTTGTDITYDGTTFKLNSSAPVISLQGTNGTGYTCQIISSGSNSDTLQINAKAFYINSDTYNFRNTATSTNYGSINTSGDLSLNIGNFITSTSGKGVNFTANTPAAGMTSQLLNWYEEGTWTPADASGAGLTFTSVTAKYTRIGRQVTATVVLTFPTTASTAQAQISGLPFAASNFGQFVLTNTGVVGGGSGLVAASGTTIALYLQTGAIRTNAACSTATVNLTGTYFV